MAEKDPWATIGAIDEAKAEARRSDKEGADKREYPRFVLDLPAEASGEAGSQPAVLHDISEGGAAVHAPQPMFTNDQFVELHMEGQATLRGRVVREFKGGYALEFDENTAEHDDR